MLLSADHRAGLAARARAEYKLRLWRALGHHVKWGRKPLFFEGMPIFRAPGEIVLGDDCRLRGGPVRTRLITGPQGRIELGDRVGIGYGVEVFAEQSVRLGHDTIVAGMVTIYDTSFHPVEEGRDVKVAPVEIGANVWIGRGVTILAGVTIGEHAVVAAGSVVAADVPPRTLVAGNPAKPIRELHASDGWQRV
jgi:acetyltransferase-like isoleucine patch superfamily enzyme